MFAIEEREGALVWCEQPTPEPREGEVRIRVRATAVNRADLVQRAGLYPPPPGASPILGLECAGVIDAIGPGVLNRAVGEEVIALLSGGGYAEQVCCPASHTLPKPAQMDWIQAAAVIEVFTTAWLNLRREGELVEGERVLIHAGASGVGTAALQLCRAWGCPAFVTVGTEEKLARCRDLGADRGAVRHGDWGAAVKSWGPVNVVLCPVGGDYVGKNLRLMAARGRLVLIGLLGGREATLPLGRLLVKRLSIRGSVLRSRSVEEKAHILAGVEGEVWPLFESGEIQPIVHQVLPITAAEQAHQAVASNATIGKVVLTIPSPPSP